MTPHTYAAGRVVVHHGDALDVLAAMPAGSVDAVCTDPPYGLEFMGKEWDRFGGEVVPVTDTGVIGRQSSPPFAGGGQRVRYGAPGRAFGAWCEAWAVECLRVLRPGGHLLAFGGTRTWHRLTCAVEDAGFEIRDTITWLYGSGFPKSLDVGKAIDRAAGAEPVPVGPLQSVQDHNIPGTGARFRNPTELAGRRIEVPTSTAPATVDAARWDGWGTALKPASEPIVVARKPLAGTVAANVLQYGTGALNIDSTRVDSAEPIAAHNGTSNPRTAMGNGWREAYQPGDAGKITQTAGRWPANVVLTHQPLTDDTGQVIGDACADGCVPGCPVADLDAQSGELTSGRLGPGHVDRGKDAGTLGAYGGRAIAQEFGADTGGASRFFPTFRYQAKADTTQRPRAGQVAHPTVKPLDLMRWLVRLVTPPGGLVLDPFAGSGTTGEAVFLEGMRAVLVEREGDYLPLIADRLTRRTDPAAHLAAKAARGEDVDLGLFAGLEGWGS